MKFSAWLINWGWLVLCTYTFSQRTSCINIYTPHTIATENSHKTATGSQSPVHTDVTLGRQGLLVSPSTTCMHVLHNLMQVFGNTKRKQATWVETLSMLHLNRQCEGSRITAGYRSRMMDSDMGYLTSAVLWDFAPNTPLGIHTSCKLLVKSSC